MLTSHFSTRDKAILIGLYLSKFNDDALTALGFEGARQAFNALGYAVGAKPASIKNYRDEFDPYFPNLRKGWHNRLLRPYCKKLLDEFGLANFTDFTELIKGVLIPDYTIEKLVEKVEKRDQAETVAKRLITGAAAEEYFKDNYRAVADFANYGLIDATKLACGFDFQLTLDVNHYAVEVKGLNAKSGSISMTEKEFSAAQSLRDRYCLFVVSNFIETPGHQHFFDPLRSGLQFSKAERQVVQTTYTTRI